MQRTREPLRAKLNAWLLTWEGTPGSDGPSGGKIIAILDGRRSHGFVEDLVDILYWRSHCTAYETALTANKRRQRDSGCKPRGVYPGHILYGRMPFIFARRVHDLTVSQDQSNGTEHLRWTELPTYGNAKVGSGIVELTPAQEREYVRAIKPLSRDRAEA
jgi:hypothetical protein